MTITGEESDRTELDKGSTNLCMRHRRGKTDGQWWIWDSTVKELNTTTMLFQLVGLGGINIYQDDSKTHIILYCWDKEYMWVRREASLRGLILLCWPSPSTSDLPPLNYPNTLLTHSSIYYSVTPWPSRKKTQEPPSWTFPIPPSPLHDFAQA